MYHEQGTPVVKQRMSFLSVLVVSVAAIVVSTIVSAAGIAVYGLGVADRQGDTLVSLLTGGLEALPDLQRALPPALADALDDQRRPDYLDQLDVSVRLVGIEGRSGRRRAVVEVSNKGDEIVSLLTMRIVASDGDGEPLAELSTAVATPLQFDGEWRGPLLPHSTRRIPIRRSWGRAGPGSLAYEITDIRVWRAGAAQDDGEAAAARPVSMAAS
ncbi:MAG: hypothetical protein ACE5E1_00955, partial [Phycisphaerae bacterium]